MDPKSTLAILALCTPALLTALPTGPAMAQGVSPTAKVESLDLETTQRGHAAVFFRSSDRTRALELAGVVDEAASMFEGKLELDFPVRVAVLGPEDWFSEFPGTPYGIPWESSDEGFLVLPASLEAGVLIQGPTEAADRRRVDFVALHEYGHLALHALLLRSGDTEPLPAPWLEELLATYFAIAYVQATDPTWAAAAKAEWRAAVAGYEPPVRSLDWSFMRDLDGRTLAQTYGWYQNVLNLRSVALYERHGLGLFQALGDGLSWDDAADWTRDSLLRDLEPIAPDLVAWARGFGETD